MIKIAFFGTPHFASEILAGLMKYRELDIALVVSQPDRAVGRKQELVLTPVKQVALDAGIEVMQPESLKRDIQAPYPTFPQKEKGQATYFSEILQCLNLDFIVVVAYGKIIPKAILDIPKHGCINLHGSILPSYRGASPVQAALRDGVSETGLTAMYMSEKMDEGDILQIAKIKVDTVDRAPDIFQKFVDIGPEFLKDTLFKVKNGEIAGIPQNHSKASYCGKISKEDGEVAFQKQSAQEIYNLFRAYTPWPGIFCYYEGKRLVIEGCYFDTLTLDEEDVDVGSFLYWGTGKDKKYGIVSRDGSVLGITQVKLEGKRSIDIASFVNGNKDILEYLFE